MFLIIVINILISFESIIDYDLEFEFSNWETLNIFWVVINFLSIIQCFFSFILTISYLIDWTTVNFYWIKLKFNHDLALRKSKGKKQEYWGTLLGQNDGWSTTTCFDLNFFDEKQPQPFFIYITCIIYDWRNVMNLISLFVSILSILKLSLYPILLISVIRKLKFVASVVKVLVLDKTWLIQIIILPIICVYIYAVLEFSVLSSDDSNL